MNTYTTVATEYSELIDAMWERYSDKVKMAYVYVFGDDSSDILAGLSKKNFKAFARNKLLGVVYRVVRDPDNEARLLIYLRKRKEQ